jgi:hypothetical protein
MSSNKNTNKTDEIVETTTTEPKKVKIKLPKIKGQNDDVFVSVNNYTCVIKRGVEVEVPEFIKEVLDHQEEMLETIMAFEEKVQR